MRKLISGRKAAALLGTYPNAIRALVQAGTITPLGKLDGDKGPYIFDREYIENRATELKPAASTGAAA